MQIDDDLLPDLPDGMQWPLALVERAVETAGMSREEILQWANEPDVLPYLPDDFRNGEGERPAK